MRKAIYTLMILGTILVISGIIASLLLENCYNKTPQEFYESYCKELVNNGWDNFSVLCSFALWTN